MRDTVDVQEIMREIRARIRDRMTPQSSQQTSVPILSMLGGPDWDRLEEAEMALESTQSLIGQLPPEPPTLRGRIGVHLVAIVRRSLFWYTPQIVRFHGVVTRSFHELRASIKTVAVAGHHNWSAVENLSRQVADLRAEADRMMSRVDAEAAARAEIMRGLAAEMGAREQLERCLDAEAAKRDDLARQIDVVAAGHEAALAQGLASELKAREELMSRVDAEAAARAEIMRGLAAEMGAREHLERCLDAETAAREALGQHVVAIANRSHSVESEFRQSDIRLLQLRTEVISQTCRVSMLLEEARKRLPAPFSEKQLVTITDEEKHALDAIYVSFEDRFRGTRLEIKERSRVYLPLLQERKIGTKRMPILDVGCGRGEWLELLLENDLTAGGVDINRVLLAYCKGAGLNVTEGDILEHLKKLPDRSLGAVTGFHIIEHLPFDILVRVFDETVRVLKPGGIAIFETPNPNNVLVGSHNFYMDFTHRNPLPSLTTQFVLEARGLCDVQVLNLHPYPESLQLPDDGTELTKRFNDYFYGPQDYAVIGRKA